MSDLKKINKILEAVIEATSEKSTMEKIGEASKEQIVRRTRVGKGVDKPGGKSQRLKPLQPSTKTKRQIAKKAGELSSVTTPAKSNLTQTGEMLDTLKVDAKVGEVTISGKDRKQQRKINEVSDDRPFLNLSKAELNGLIDILDKIIDKLIK